MKIKKIEAHQILDSRGIPTICTKVILESGVFAYASVPSGASTGKYEAVELRDNEKNEYNGKGVKNAINNVNTVINQLLEGISVFNQTEIDKKMTDEDATQNKSRLGANAILSVSLACAKAAAKSLNSELYRYIGGINANTLPIPMMNILNGGAHADNNVEIQEFMIFPSGAHSFLDAMKIGTEIYYSLKDILKSKNLSTAVGDEGGFAPNLEKDSQALDLIVQSIEKAGYRPGHDVFICLDIAASEWAKNKNNYIFPKENRPVSVDELFYYYENLIKNYPIFSIEDPFSEDDFLNFAKFRKKTNNKIQIVGDDLFVTNINRLKKGINLESGNAVLIKPNQIGTLSETLDTVRFAQKNGYSTIISHRSGETDDTSISDIAVATNSFQIKAGAPARGERICKYNRLIFIESQLNSKFALF